MSSLAHRVNLIRNRRKARRSVRIMSRNIRTAAARKGIRSIPALSLAAGVPIRRTALMWLGINMTVTEMTRYMVRLDMDTTALFAGTGDAA